MKKNDDLNYFPKLWKVSKTKRIEILNTLLSTMGVVFRLKSPTIRGLKSSTKQTFKDSQPTTTASKQRKVKSSVFSIAMTNMNQTTSKRWTSSTTNFLDSKCLISVVHTSTQMVCPHKELRFVLKGKKWVMKSLEEGIS